MSDLSIKDKVKDIVVSDETFNNKETGEVIDYKRINIVVEVGGVEKIIPTAVVKSYGKAGYDILDVADVL